MTKKILITGKNSYVGSQLANWLANEPDKYEVLKESARDDKWKDIDFSIFDIVVHVIGVAHIKETKENRTLYFEINRDLAYEIALKAKANGVNQFIFLSTMSVYGVETGVINENTLPNPKSAYGQSKLEAEELIRKLQDDTFKVAIVRPPMVYGKGCKGNYQKLACFAGKIPCFPEIDNKRSMIYIDNLSEFIKLLINECKSGLFLPQNKEYVNTSEMIKIIREVHGKKTKTTKIFNPLIKKLFKLKNINKVFGDLVYETADSMGKLDHIVFDFSESIKMTEE